MPNSTINFAGKKKKRLRICKLIFHRMLLGLANSNQTSSFLGALDVIYFIIKIHLVPCTDFVLGFQKPKGIKIVLMRLIS